MARCTWPFLNKILKDIIVKSRTLDGYECAVCAGWDFHGLPIEMPGRKDSRPRRAKIQPKAFRAACASTLSKQIDLQRRSSSA